MRVTRRLRLWGGTLKLKHREELRYEERAREVPVWRFGSRYLTWWSDEAEAEAARKATVRMKLSPEKPRDAAGDGLAALGLPPRES